MLLYYLVTYRLDSVALVAAAVAGLFACRRILRSRTPERTRLSWRMEAVAAVLVVAGVVLGEVSADRQRAFLTSVFAGIGPTYARELQRAGHAKITFSTPPSDPTYLHLIELQRDWLRLNPLIADIYTVRRDAAGQVRFLVDSETDYNGDGRIDGPREQRTPIGEAYPQITPPFFEALAGRTVFDPAIVADRWGVWVSSLSPIFDDHGAVDGVVGIDYPAHDWLRALALRRLFVSVTVFVLLGLLLSSATLVTLMQAEIVERRTAELELQKAKEAADTASRAKGEFLAVMSHEIRTPLTAITGYASMLEDTPLDTVQQRYVHTMRRGAASLVDLLNNILDYSKIEDGKLQLDVLPCAPTEIVRDVIDLLAPTAREKQLALRCDDELGPALWVAADPSRVRQIVMNLVGNAVKFTSAGSVTVTLRWTPSAPESVAGTLSIVVADTGPGIAPDRLPHLFQMFTQAEPGTSRRYGGTGLGLAISRQLVDMMQGTITVQSTVGRGSVFTVTVPCPRAAAPVGAAPAPSAPQATTAPVQPSAESNRLLVVDDNPINCDVIEAMLMNTGYETDIVNSGAEAIARAAQQRYAAILMDVAMPEMDGLAATRRIRASESGFRTPIIAVTAATSRADRAACLACGMDEFVAKPIDRKFLLSVLERFCRRSTPSE